MAVCVKRLLQRSTLTGVDSDDDLLRPGLTQGMFTMPCRGRILLSSCRDGIGRRLYCALRTAQVAQNDMGVGPSFRPL